jgi:hypothetical protein
MEDMGVLIKEATRLFPTPRVFVFSDRWSCHLFGDLDIIFWDVGSQEIGESLVGSKNDFIYMSGYNSGLIRPFFEENLEDRGVDNRGLMDDKEGFLSGLLKRQYSPWNYYFDEFVCQVNG